MIRILKFLQKTTPVFKPNNFQNDLLKESYPKQRRTFTTTLSKPNFSLNDNFFLTKTEGTNNRNQINKSLVDSKVASKLIPITEKDEQYWSKLSSDDKINYAME